MFYLEFVIPAKAGIHIAEILGCCAMDPRLRGDDSIGIFKQLLLSGKLQKKYYQNPEIDPQHDDVIRLPPGGHLFGRKAFRAKQQSARSQAQDKE